MKKENVKILIFVYPLLSRQLESLGRTEANGGKCLILCCVFLMREHANCFYMGFCFGIRNASLAVVKRRNETKVRVLWRIPFLVHVILN